MATNDDVVFRIGGDTAGLRRETKRAGISMKNLAKNTRAAMSRTAVAVTAATATLIAGLTKMVNTSRDAIDTQAKLAAQFNTTSASMATLRRATERSGVSMDQINTGARTLTVRMGEAQQGLKSAEDAFKALKLDADELSRLPLDKRISAINNALRENVTQSQRAAYAADLFGTRAATALMQLDDDTLETARKEMERFGLALSDVDAAKVEAANDQIELATKVFSGFAQQLTVRLAPVLQAVAELLTDNATEVGDLGTAADKSFGFIIKAVGFVSDAFSGLKRLVKVVADAVIIQLETMRAAALGVAYRVIEGLDKIPGVDMSEAVDKLRDQIHLSTGIIKAGVENIKETINTPMPSRVFEKFVADAQESGTKAAEAIAKARAEASLDPVGMAGGAAGGDDADKKREELAKNLEVIREANLLELEALQEKLAAERQVINDAREQKLIDEETYEEQLKRTKDRYEKQRSQIEERESQRRQQIAEMEKQAKMNALSELTTLMNSESRKMFEIGKAAAIAQSLVNTYQSVTAAMAQVPWPLNIAVAAANLATGLHNVQQIRSQQFGSGGGGGGAASNTQAVNAATEPTGSGGGGGPNQGQTLFVEGLSNESLFSGDRVRNMVESIRDFQRDGGDVVINSD